jgi:hypothetical protein
MILDDLFEGNLPPNIRPSDIPPAMRARLTMRDIDKERAQGGVRYRVGDKEFMSVAAAQEFAAGTGEKIQPIREEKKSNPRIERILKQLRVRHPQAEDDLEALIYDFRSQQAQDRRDIGQLYAQDAQEDAAIERLEKMLDIIRQRRGLDADADITEETTAGHGVRIARDHDENIVDEAKKDRSPGKITKSEDPCWSGYHMVGTKKKNGREVPNCVPGKKGT